MQIITRQRDEFLRHTFSEELSVYNGDMFIFLDETGTDRRDTLQRYVYSWRGKPAKLHKLLVCREHLTAITLMSCAGILDCHIVHGAVDGDVFYELFCSEQSPSSPNAF